MSVMGFSDTILNITLIIRDPEERGGKRGGKKRWKKGVEKRGGKKRWKNEGEKWRYCESERQSVK